MKKTNEARERERTSRRRFTKRVAAAALIAPLAAVGAGSAQTPTRTPAAEPKAPPNPQPASPQTPQPSPVAEAYAEVAKARFGKQVSDDEFKRIKRDLEGNVRTAERMSAFKLENWDEPDFIFSA